MAIELVWLEDSRAQRIVWLLEELRVPYSVRLFKRDPESHLGGPDLRAAHPTGKAPILFDDGKAYAESGIIINHLISKYDSKKELTPVDDAEAEKIQYYLFNAEGSLQPVMLVLFLAHKIRMASVPFIAKPVIKNVAASLADNFALPDCQKQLKLLDEALKSNGSGFLVGNHLSAADIIFAYPLECAVERGVLSASAYPYVHRWLSSMKARPAWQRAEKKTASK